LSREGWLRSGTSNSVGVSHFSEQDIPLLLFEAILRFSGGERRIDGSSQSLEGTLLEDLGTAFSELSLRD